MLYGWARLYSEQLTREAEYHHLRPVVSIWICEQDAIPKAEKANLRFQLQEMDERFALHDDIRFELVQLSRVRAARVAAQAVAAAAEAAAEAAEAALSMKQAEIESLRAQLAAALAERSRQE
ncbi:MAG: hypothetical protein EXR69_08890 [Myxococcales bacterium]|nr:hypothetical protein [Myxococcales bacterium]